MPSLCARARLSRAPVLSMGHRWCREMHGNSGFHQGFQSQPGSYAAYLWLCKLATSISTYIQSSMLTSSRSVVAGGCIELSSSSFPFQKWSLSHQFHGLFRPLQPKHMLRDPAAKLCRHHCRGSLLYVSYDSAGSMMTVRQGRQWYFCLLCCFLILAQTISW